MNYYFRKGVFMKKILLIIMSLFVFISLDSVAFANENNKDVSDSNHFVRTNNTIVYNTLKKEEYFF